MRQGDRPQTICTTESVGNKKRLSKSRFLCLRSMHSVFKILRYHRMHRQKTETHRSNPTFGEPHRIHNLFVLEIKPGTELEFPVVA